MILCVSYCQGGFGAQNVPRVDEFVAYFLNEFDGFVAFPNIRGEGGGTQPNWHGLGRSLNKTNTIDDFIAAAEYVRKTINKQKCNAKLYLMLPFINFNSMFLKEGANLYINIQRI